MGPVTERAERIMDWLRFGLAMLALLATAACRADAGIYAFVDRQGEVYLTNLPDDARYEILIESPAPPVIVGPSRSAATQASSGRIAALPYGPEVARVAGRYGLEAALIHAMISVESGNNPNAVSRRGAAGLMQLMPVTARRYGVANVFDPAENVRAGAQYLSDLLKLFDNDLRLALAAYNAGEAAVLRYGRRIPPFGETAAYVPKVVDTYQRFRLTM
jgi:soluble lytic murein transglycosylase-like protein